MAGSNFSRTAVAGAFVALLLTACGQQQDQQQQHGGPPPVSVAPAISREVQDFDEFTARLEAPDTVEIRARVAGTLDKVHFREGQVVKKGDPLFTIDPRPFRAEVARAEAQLAAARTAADLAKADLGRAEKLVAIQGVSQQEIDQLKSSVRNNDANIRAAEAAVTQAKLNLEFTEVRAPVTGRSSRANVTAGNLVNVGEPVLTTVVSSDKVYAYFDASEATFLKYAAAARAGGAKREQANKVYLGLANEQGYPHEGRMDFVDNRLNPATATIRGRAVFDNKDGTFTPGLFARVKLEGTGAYTATLIPERAIGTDQSNKVVMVVGPNNIVAPRPVVPGAQFDGYRAVQGVKPGELVIFDGLQHAMPGAPVTPQTVKLDDKGRAVAPPQGAAPAAPAASK
ncbi:efflux RND transporter periplasmic adaptor subunit [Mitsuaria sp. GD03876]|uniref:efflux RND transporter periplasmic adaptor subunit n=1 Tax=Mitsuaria sp. GD03876 TaxID=2975399 RepID=UPI0024469764|nr:efflux RND transporter periplasmic adaptor subunit [Mitsuaria sp. GD03876]MDH0865565.1 efflux RND transporter periplasmic adaptor subunit [Mitsuaria sp. GD03876]